MQALEITESSLLNTPILSTFNYTAFFILKKREESRKSGRVRDICFVVHM